MFFSHVWTSLIRQKELAKDQGEWNLCLSLSFSQPVSFTPSFITIFDTSPSLICFCSQPRSLFSWSVPVVSALHWTSSLLSFSWLAVSFSQQLITAFSLHLLFLCLSEHFFSFISFHCWNTSPPPSSQLFALPLFGFLFPHLSSCQAVSSQTCSCKTNTEK